MIHETEPREDTPRCISAERRTRTRRRLVARVVALLAVVALAEPVLGDWMEGFDNEWAWRYFGTEDGLPAERVDHVCEAADGISWVATSAGLAWYDGYRWHAMGPQQGVPSKPCAHLCPDVDSGVVAVVGGTLYRGDQHGFRKIAVRLKEEGDTILSAVPYRDGVVVAVRHRRGGECPALLVREGEQVPFPGPDTGDPPGVFRVWMMDPWGIWVHARGGLYRWDGDTWQLHMAAEGPLGNVQYAAERQGIGFACLYALRHPYGIWRWSGESEPELMFQLEPERLQALAIGPEGRAIAAIDSGRVLLFQQDQMRTLEDAPARLADIRCAGFRATGDLWLGTGRGVSLYGPAASLWEYWRDPTLKIQSRVNEIMQARNGDVWIATCDVVRIHRTDGTVENLTEIDGTPIGEVTGVAQDGEGHIWLVSGSWFEGAFRYDGAEWKYFGIEQGLEGYQHKIRIDRRGRPWFCGLGVGGDPRSLRGAGVAVYEDGGFRHMTTADGLLHDRVYAFAEGLDGTLWFGTGGGLSRLKAGRWTHWTTENGLRDAKIWTLAVDEENVLWFGGKWHGLAYVREDEICYTPTDEAMLDVGLRDIRADPLGGIWATFPGGVARVKGGRSYTFRARDGVGHLALWPVLPTRERIFLGTLGAGTAVLDRAALEACSLAANIEEPIVRKGTVGLRWHAAARDGLIDRRFIHTRLSLDGGPWSPWSPGHSVELEALPGSHELVVQARTTWAEAPKAQAFLAFAVPVPVYRQPLVMIPVVAAILTAVISVMALLVRRARHLAAVRANVELRREIAERRQAEDALGASEERFRLATQATRDAIYDWDIVADRSWRNNRYRELFAPDPSSSYDPWRARIHPDDRERVAASLQACFDGDDHYWGEEYRLAAADGRYAHVMDRGFILRSEDGRPLRMIGAMTDITEAKQAQEALRASEARFDRAVRGSQDGLWDWPDVRQESEWWSPRFFELLGYQPGAFEASGWRLDALLHPEDQARTRAALRAHLEHKVPYDVEYRLRTREGDYRWFRARGQAEWDEEGQPLRMAGSIQDITGRKLVEEELARHRGHLEELVRRRTNELEQSQAKLRLAERLASIGTLAAGIAHEINNPVGGILLAAQNARLVLEGKDCDPSLRVCLDDVEENARRCGVITGNILQFAKEGHLQKRPSNLNAVVQRGVRMTAAYVDHHGGEVDLQLADCLPDVLVYPLGMEQVVANLIRNAVESASVKARVEIRTEQANGAVRLVVRDNGRGVAPDQVRHLFDPFYTTRQEEGGIGLGLSIVHGIITEHGGTIEVESQPGEGTVFSIELPTAGTGQMGAEDAESTGRR